MIDPITQYLLEGYLMSDKTISIDMDKFIIHGDELEAFSYPSSIPFNISTAISRRCFNSDRIFS